MKWSRFGIMTSQWNKVICVVPVVITILFAFFSNTFSSMNCSCDDEIWIWWQRFGDFMILIALVYFLTHAQLFPPRKTIVQVVLFTVLCGSTHFMAIWTYTHGTPAIIWIQTILKMCTAVVSFWVATTLVGQIPEFFHMIAQEHLLIHKTEELHRELDRIKAKDAVGQNMKMLTHEIRRTLDRNTILNIILLKLPRCLGLENCAIWMPNLDANALELMDELDRRPVKETLIVPVTDDVVQTIIESNQPVLIPSDCALSKASNHRGISDMLAAVRLPMLSSSNFKYGTPKSVNTSYGIMVLLLSHEWHQHELDMIVTVADQVAVALSHAAVLEDSILVRNNLCEQNRALHRAKIETATAIRARHQFLEVTNFHFQIPVHDILTLATLLQDSKLSVKNKLLVDIIARSSSILPAVIRDVMDFAHGEDSNLCLEVHSFEFSTVLKQAVNALHQKMESKGLTLKFDVAGDLPSHVIGDEKRFYQIVLSIMSIAVDFANGGCILVCANVQRINRLLRTRSNDEAPSSGGGSLYVRVDVKIPGLAFLEEDASDSGQSGTRSFGNGRVELVICKKLVQLMQGYLKVEKDGLDTSIFTFAVKFQLPFSSGGKFCKWDRHLRGDLTDLSVLLFDDRSTSCMVTKRILDKFGCQTMLACSEHEVVHSLSSPGDPLDILLLDVSMHEVNAFEIALKVRQLFGPGERPLLVALAMNGDKSVQERCFQLGIDEIILKPFSSQDMRVALSKLLVRMTPHKHNEIERNLLSLR